MSSPPPKYPFPLITSVPDSALPLVMGSLAETLLLTTYAATNRDEEAISLFENIASVLDDALSEIVLPQHLTMNFREFISDLTAVARRHFECHIKGIPRPPTPYSTGAATLTPLQTDSQTRNKIQNNALPKTSTSYLYAAKMLSQKHDIYPKQFRL